MPEPLLQLILGSLGITITGLAGYIVKQWANERADLKADGKFWRDLYMSKEEKVGKALDTLQDALDLAKEREREKERRG